jgi:hypothetical protein
MWSRPPVVWVIRPVGSPICSTRPDASTSVLSGTTSWYFSDEDPELITSTGPLIADPPTALTRRSPPPAPP